MYLHFNNANTSLIIFPRNRTKPFLPKFTGFSRFKYTSVRIAESTFITTGIKNDVRKKTFHSFAQACSKISWDFFQKMMKIYFFELEFCE